MSCSNYKVSDTLSNNCPNQKYIETITMHKKEKNGSVTVFNTNESFTFQNLLDNAQIKHGKDITINNVKWDIKQTNFFGFKWDKTIGATYDVIKCK
jgi:hypothetical protein